MKTFLRRIWLFIACGSALVLHGQEVRVTRLGPDQDRVEWVSSRFDEDRGEWLNQTNGYTQLGTGMNYWNEDSGTWEASVEEIVILEGGAAALRTPQKVFFAPTLDDPEGSIDYLSPDGTRLRSAILALTYFDPLSGRRATMGVVRDVQGELLPPNRVIYRDAFESADPRLPVHADVVYTFRLSGLEQDVILRALPPIPESYGIPSDIARLEVLTEFFEAPEPQRQGRVMASLEQEDLRARVAEPDWIDERLDFGGAIVGAGRAFRLDLEAAVPPSEPSSMAVAKRWIEDNGRKILAEGIEFIEAVPELLQLPDAREAAVRQGLPEALLAADRTIPSWGDRLTEQLSGSSQHAAVSDVIPARPARTHWEPEPVFAMASRPLDDTPGFVIDYVTMALNSSNFTFRADETYFITNTVNLTGTTTLEGGTVVKYNKYPGGSIKPEILIFGPFVSATSHYRPAVFTARDDQTIGQTIAGSAPTPDLAYYYAAHGLWFQNTNEVVRLENIRFRYGWTPVIFWNCDGILRNSQFQHCANAVYANSAVHVAIQNMLAVDGTPDYAPLKAYYGASIHAEHVTIANASRLINKDASSQVTLVNSILSGIGTFQNYIGRHDPAYGNFESASATGIFESVGAGGYYLPADSPHRNAGVTAISGSTAVELGRLTTSAPMILSGDFTTDTTLASQAVRDIDIPDRGYHYPPLDYCISSLNLTNAALLLTNGVAVGIYGPRGLLIRRNGRLLSEGSPGRLNRLVRYNTVQEGLANWGGAPSNSFTMLRVDTGGGLPTPTVAMRFTEVAHMAISTNSTAARRLLQAGASNDGGTIALSHCELRGIDIDVSYAVTHPQTVALTNNLFEGSTVRLMDIATYSILHFSAYNNLFLRGRLALENQDTNTWILRDNLVATDTLSFAGYSYGASHNAFRAGLTAFGSSNKTGIVPDFVSGPLGRFYYPTSGGSTSLASLVNSGSRNATNAGLYHFTVHAHQAKETNSVVDIGYHYVAGPQSGARFLGTDTMTQGSWLGIHGTAGHLVVRASTNLPPGVTVVAAGHSTTTWSSSTSDTRALLRPDGSSRIAACWHSATQFDVSLSLPPGQVQRVAFYMLDWDSHVRAAEIRALHTGTGEVLDVRGVDQFNGGRYLIYDVAGDVTFRFTRAGGSNAVLSGLFFAPGAFFPADQDRDGMADYGEDQNGNGATQGSESDWQQYQGAMGADASLLIYTPLQP